MNKLTAEKCRQFIISMKSEQDRSQLSITDGYQLQALEIALPILEQQDHEKSIIAEQLEAVRDYLALTPHQDAIISCAIDRLNLLTSRTLELSRSLIKQQERGELVRVAFTGSGSLEAIKHGGEGFIWGSRADAHPIELFIHSKDAACQKCGGTGMADSGGTQPWGEQILIECDCKFEQQERGEGYWIEWGGGDQPVDDYAVVEVRFRNGSVEEGERAECYEWNHGYHDLSTTEVDIIAYRIIPERATNQNGEQ